ncbi:NUDIX domain-containing protein [Neorhizobium turbinariae]|uniref:NUDIX domain-containing protein n=1 Tax=Neorhizobium turbinariae TaxID=2937795 RepID=UPI0036F1A814
MPSRTRSVEHVRHILIHRSVDDPFWAFPGGRIEFHEASAETLSREIEEELGTISVVGPMGF